MAYTVYKHTSPSGKVYIGITSQKPELRWKNGIGYMNQTFYRAIQKYGWENIKHEILFTGLTKEEAEQKEIELIAYYKSNDSNFGYNNANGGNTIGKHTVETKRKISESHIGELNPFYGKHHSESTKQTILECSKNRTVTEEHKMNISKALKGKYLGVNNPRSIKVEQYDKDYNLIKTWNSMADVERELYIPRGRISACCKGKRKTAGSYIWRYADVS